MNECNFSHFPFKSVLPETILAVEAAQKAGKAILKIYSGDFSVKFKEEKEPVTEADIQSNKIICEMLQKYNYPILSEESEDNFSRLQHRKVWVVDPLDGTADFIDKSGEFSIMIALVIDGLPQLGVVYCPASDILFVGQKGSGAFVHNGKEWHSLHVNSTLNLSSCRAVMSRHHLGEEEKKFLQQLAVTNFVQKGSCGIKVAEICWGKADFYFTTTNKIKHWDSCAAYCLITESGGKMTNMLGQEPRYNTERINHEQGLLVSNGLLHDTLVQQYSVSKNTNN